MMFPNAINGHMPFAPPHRTSLPRLVNKTEKSIKNAPICQKTSSDPGMPTSQKVDLITLCSLSDLQCQRQSLTAALSNRSQNTSASPSMSTSSKPSNVRIHSNSFSSSGSSSYENKDTSFKSFMKNLLKPSSKSLKHKKAFHQSNNSDSIVGDSKSADSKNTQLDYKEQIVFTEKDIRDFLEKSVSKTDDNNNIELAGIIKSNSAACDSVNDADNKIVVTMRCNSKLSSLHRSLSVNGACGSRLPKLQSIVEEDEHNYAQLRRTGGISTEGVKSGGQCTRPSSDHIDIKSKVYRELQLLSFENKAVKQHNSSESLHDNNTDDTFLTLVT